MFRKSEYTCETLWKYCESWHYKNDQKDLDADTKK